MARDTSEIVKELGLCADFRTFYEENRDELVTEGLPALLAELMQKKSLSKSVVIRNSELVEVYAYQIFSGVRHPERKKLLALTTGMELTFSETQTLLKKAGYPPLYVKNPFDCVVSYGICQKFTVSQINALLFEYGLETLG